jgi:hypothetical protein
MTVKDILRIRLQQQQLVKPQFEKPGDVVSWLGAVQGQDFFGALWGIGQRMKHAKEPDVEKAINDRTIVRTWPMRGTLHFVAPKDVRWMLKHLTPRIISRTAGLHKQAELDNKVFLKSRKLWEKALEGGKQLTRDEMYDVLERAKIKTANTRGLHILAVLAQQGSICFGARRGKQQTFTLLDEWIPPYKMLDKDEALAELAKRYFASHGPALTTDFMWWAGLTKADAEAGISLTGSKLVKEIINNKIYWLSPDIPSAKIESKVYLLPTYDEYGIAYKDRSAIIDPATEKNVGTTFISAIISHGKMIGIWRRTIEKNKVHIETKPFSVFSKSQITAIASAARRYAEFIQTPISE